MQTSTLSEAFPSAAEALPVCPGTEHSRATPSPASPPEQDSALTCLGQPPCSAFPLIRRERGQLERGSPRAQHQTLPVRPADQAARAHFCPFFPSLPAGDGQISRSSAPGAPPACCPDLVCKGRIPAVPQLGSRSCKTQAV